MKMPKSFKSTSIAPCGICCNVCYVYLRERNPCKGCRDNTGSQPNSCRSCKIKDCVDSRGLKGCHECEEMPCALIKRLDKSYRKRYGVSLTENLAMLAIAGRREFLSVEKERWTCAYCGGVISLHDGECSECGMDERN